MSGGGLKILVLRPKRCGGGRRHAGRAKEVTLSRRAWNLPGVVGLLAICIAAPAQPQGNIDAGKTPAQMFSSTCTACHRRPQELKRASAGFLRQHYMPSAEEAAAMASYLASVGSDPRAVKDRGKPQQPS